MPPPPKTLRQRVKCALLGGEKGSGLPEYSPGYGHAVGKGAKAQKLRVHGKGKEVQKQENPVARLKLLLVGFVFHSWLIWDYNVLICWKYRSPRS
jgi:hydroxymethylglutaryl-CoA reductase (NADPH)